MKIFSSEFAHDYDSYTFGYGNYLVKEAGDSLSLIYEKGYLPYSGAKNIQNTFYMARSARVRISDFELNSENKRIAKKFDGMFTGQRTALGDFKIDDQFLDFCLSYFENRHGKNVMPKERLLTILNSGLISHVVSYSIGNEIKAYVLEVSDKEILHFWFSFYDLSLVNQSLGMWLMIDIARKVKEVGKKYFYLGTVYGEKALYKTNFDSLEYWDGEKWIADIKKLKELSRNDEALHFSGSDLWKKDLPIF